MVSEIHLPDAPDIPGLVFRGFRGEPDYAAIAAVIHGCKVADGIERTTTAEATSQRVPATGERRDAPTGRPARLRIFCRRHIGRRRGVLRTGCDRDHARAADRSFKWSL
jgi:hypothetical protein